MTVAARVTLVPALLAVLTAIVTGQQPVRSELVGQSERTPAPSFRLTDSGGKTVQLADFRGTAVVLNFWATECGGCKVELPTFATLDRTYKSQGLTVLGVSLDIMYSELKDAAAGWSQVERFLR